MFVAFTQIPTGEFQLFTTLPFLQVIYAVAVRRKSTLPVIPINYRLVSGERASRDGSLPRDQLSLGGQSELVSWWFVPDNTHGTSSSILLSRYNRSSLVVTSAGLEFHPHHY